MLRSESGRWTVGYPHFSTPPFLLLLSLSLLKKYIFLLLLFSGRRKKQTLLGPVGPQIRPIKFELAARLRYGLRPKRVGACVVKVRRQPRGPLRGRGPRERGELARSPTRSVGCGVRYIHALFRSIKSKCKIFINHLHSILNIVEK